MVILTPACVFFTIFQTPRKKTGVDSSFNIGLPPIAHNNHDSLSLEYSNVKYNPFSVMKYNSNKYSSGKHCFFSHRLNGEEIRGLPTRFAVQFTLRRFNDHQIGIISILIRIFLWHQLVIILIGTNEFHRLEIGSLLMSLDIFILIVKVGRHTDYFSKILPEINHLAIFFPNDNSHRRTWQDDSLILSPDLT